MAAITDLSDLINKATGGASGAPEIVFFFKGDRRDGGTAQGAPTAARWSSLWRSDGIPSAGSIPTSAAACSKATAGALPFTNPAGGRQKFLLAMEGAIGGISSLMAYDRLLHCGGLSGTVTTAQTVGGTLTRYATGAASIGNQIWIEIYTTIGATLTTITASYTNQDGTSGRTTPPASIGSATYNNIHTMFPLPLQAGDTGVQSVQSVTLAATTGTAGNFGVTILKPIGIVDCPSTAVAGKKDFISSVPGPFEVLSDACIAFAFTPAAATFPPLFLGSFSFIDS